MKELHSEVSFKLQRLTTGHVAPFEDNDIYECVKATGRFPHGPIITGCVDPTRVGATYSGVKELEEMPSGSVVVDCGAFIGDNTSEFVSYGWTVFAFEPFYDAYCCLCINSPKSINVMAPVGNGEKVKLNYDCPGTNHGMRSVDVHPDGVPSTRVDDLPIGRVDFIKIDCEGHERFVLEGCKHTILKHRPYLYIEIFPEVLSKKGYGLHEIETLLKEYGYSTRMIGCPPRFDWFCLPSIKQ